MGEFRKFYDLSTRTTMYDFHNSTDTLKFRTEKRAINKTHHPSHTGQNAETLRNVNKSETDMHQKKLAINY